ncbi:pleckstrin homology domain-containing family A member 7-like isoform X11 [Octopus vulgaris]|uniref:Pleckstrin homology domain-containing family A member 7-like isoform X11 n=2 Tax=Octopus vulgaris TaxID=6645 RepID=A0AA36F8G9_OCTVU|nr:pleckstrin homology domain-containing family A member 7-like isoform X11 [Octopus vulgaris]
MATVSELIEPLPQNWTYGVTADGRIFYIDDLHETTSWVHPVTNKSAKSGLLYDPDLPSGWELSITPEGVFYYVDHNSQRTTFIHPLTRRTAPPFNDSTQSVESQRPLALKPVPQYNQNKKASGKQRLISKAPEAKRMSDSKVIHSGWLTVQENSGLRSWKQRWCVHVDYGLFFYKDASEQQCVGSILLPSYTIRPCDASDSINKRHAFKAEHANMKTQYFVAESVESMDQWVRVLNQSALMIEAQENSRLKESFRNPSFTTEYNGSVTRSEQQPEYYPAESPVQHFSNGHHSLHNPNNNGYSTSNSFPLSNSVPSSQRSSYIYQEQNPTSEHLPHNRSSYSSAGSYGINRSYSDSIPQPQPASYLLDAPYQRASSSSLTYQYSNRPPEQIPRDNESQLSLGFNTSQNGYLRGSPYLDDSRHSPTSFKGTNNNDIKDTIYRTIDFSSTDNRINNSSSNSPKSLPRPPLSPTHSQLSTDTYPKEINYAVIQQQSNQDSYSPLAESHNSFSYSNNKDADLYFTDVVDSPQSNLSQNHSAMLPTNPVAPYSKDMYGAQTDLSKLSIESDLAYQSPNPEYAAIQRRSTGNLENLYKSDALLSDRPNSISAPVRRSLSDVPKQTSLQLLQNMHMNELRKHPSFSKTFPKNYSPNYQNISQTFSQYSDDDDDDDQFEKLSNEGPVTSDGDKWKQIPSDYYKRPSSTDPANLLDQDIPDNDADKILYDYKGTSHDTSFPTRSFQELSVKTLDHSNDSEFGVTKPPVSEYANLNARQSFAYSSSRSELDEILPRSSSGNFDDYDYGKYSPSHVNLNGFQAPTMYNAADVESISSSNMQLEKKEDNISYMQPALQSETITPVYNRNTRLKRNMSTVKEDPDMPDEDVIQTTRPVIAKLKANTARLRMSISADDLLGKTHEELVLLLIQLRRNKAKFEKNRVSLREQIEALRPFEQEFKRQLAEHNTVLDFHLEDKHGHYMELKRQCDDVENKLEMYKPIESLVDNMVTMGSLYGGNNYMLATQYRKHILHPDEYIPPKNMIEFSRKHQEEQIFQQIEKDVQELTQDEADLEEKMERLYVLDKLIQEMSLAVTGLKEDKESLETTLRGVLIEQQNQHTIDPRQLEHFRHKEYSIKRELSRAMQQLAEASKRLEELTAESSKLEHEIALLRSKVHGDLNRSRSAPNLPGDPTNTRYQMEKDLHRVQDVMLNLNKEAARLSEALNTLKSPGSVEEELSRTPNQSTTYYETDLDTKITVDLAVQFNFADQGNGTFQEDRPGFVEYIQSQSAPLSEGNNSYIDSNSVPDPIYAFNEEPLQAETQIRQVYSKPPFEGSDPGLLTADEADAAEAENWNIEEADDNTKRFFGLLPKERPRVQTVRDVKRQAEQRRERVGGGSDKMRGYPGDDGEWENEITSPDSKLKRSPRGRARYLTISSSEPIKLEHALEQKSSLNTAAGDLIIGSSLMNNMPDIIQSSTLDNFDELTIDRELMMPEKVLIPERYMPDSDDEDLSEEEKEKRREKSERIRKVLAEQSVHSWAKTAPEEMKDGLHEYVAKERQNREKLLTIAQELAMEVTRKSKAAAVERRKTWAGTPSFDYLSTFNESPAIYNNDILLG